MASVSSVCMQGGDGGETAAPGAYEADRIRVGEMGVYEVEALRGQPGCEIANATGADQAATRERKMGISSRSSSRV